MLPTVAERQTNKRGGRKPKKYKHKDPRLAFHLPDELLAAFNACIASLRPPPTDSAMLRTFVEEALERRGFWPRHDQHNP